jgi:hypothetical protein
VPDTLLSLFLNPNDLLSLEPEELGGVILKVAPGVMQNGVFNIGGLLAPLFPPNGKGYPVGLHNDVRLAIAEALSWLTNQGLVMLDPDQPASWYRPTRRDAQLKTRADIEAFRKLHSRGPLVEQLGDVPSVDMDSGSETVPWPPPARRRRGDIFNTAEFNTVEFNAAPPPPVSERPSGTTVITPAPGVPVQPAPALSSRVASTSAVQPEPTREPNVEPVTRFPTEPDDASTCCAAGLTHSGAGNAFRAQQDRCDRLCAPGCTGSEG